MRDLVATAGTDGLRDSDPSLDTHRPPHSLLQQLNITKVSSSHPPQRRGNLGIYFRTEKPVCLADLFDFATEKAPIWENLWKGGKSGLLLVEEMDFVASQELPPTAIEIAREFTDFRIYWIFLH